jgi:hypothetical protein
MPWCALLCCSGQAGHLALKTCDRARRLLRKLVSSSQQCRVHELGAAVESDTDRVPHVAILDCASQPAVPRVVWRATVLPRRARPMAKEGNSSECDCEPAEQAL